MACFLQHPVTMFVRTKKTPNSLKIAVQLVENQRSGNNIKQVIIRHIGYGINDEEVDALKLIALKYKLDIEQDKTGQAAIFSKDSLLEAIHLGSHQAEQEALKALPVNLKNIKEEKRIVMGIHAAFGKLFDEMGFGRVIHNPSRKKASVKLLRNTVMARIAQPISKRASAALLSHTYGLDVDVNALYRMMDLLDATAIEKTKTTAFTYVSGLLAEKVNVIFYDCTTLYFESFIEDELKQNGYSKDGKFNQSQVLLALMVTTAGLPLGYELFEGSKFEGHTLDNALERLHNKYKINKIIFVADAALISHENIEKFITTGQPFIVGARIKNLDSALTAQVLDKEGYQQLHQQEDIAEAATYKDIAAKEKALRLIVTHSAKRAAKDKHDREKAIESLTKRIEKSKNPISLLNNFGYKKFIKLEGEAKISKDHDKIKQAEKWDGLHGIITNIKEETALNLLHHYKGLWQVEETFRISKHDLRMRPVFHWKPRRIHAHIAICFMALCAARLIEYKVRLQYKKLSPAAIKRELSALQLSVLKDTATQKQYALPSKASQDAKKIYQLLDLKWNDTPFEIKRKPLK